MDAIQPKLIEIFRAALSLELDDSTIQQLTRTDCPAWDSMGHLNILLATEQAFTISIPEDRGATISSYWGLVELVETLTHAAT